ncbi:MAG: type IV pilus assembly protein PilM [bacterium]
MSNFLQRIFQENNQSVIGVDIGSSSIKVVQLKKHRGKAVLETYGEIALAPYAGLQVGQVAVLPAEKIAEAIKDIIKEANVTSLISGVSIPFKSSLVSLIELPKVSDAELKEMIPLEARKYIPVPISEVTMDWWVIPNEHGDLDFVDAEDEEGEKTNVPQKVQVLVVSIHNEVLSNYSSIVNQAGLDTGFFEIEMFSSTRALISGEIEPVMIFDMGAAATKIYMIERGIIKSSHIINKGSQEVSTSISKGMNVTFDSAEHMKRSLGTLAPADEQKIYEIISLTMDYIFSEANSVLLSYQKRFNKTVSKVILTGGGVAMKGIVEMAAANFQTTVEIGDPFSKVEAPAFLEGVLKNAGLEFAVAVGIALRRLQEVS